MLTAEETEWLNTYHQWVYNELSPRINDELKVFLKEQTRPV